MPLTTMVKLMQKTTKILNTDDAALWPTEKDANTSRMYANLQKVEKYAHFIQAEYEHFEVHHCEKQQLTCDQDALQHPEAVWYCP